SPNNFLLNITGNYSASWSVVNGTAFTANDVPRRMWISGPAANPTVYQPIIRSDNTIGLIKITNVRSGQATLTHIDATLSNIGGYCEQFYCPNVAFGADPFDPTHLLLADRGSSQMKASSDGGATWTVDTNLT